MKILFIIIVAVMILAGGAFGVLKTMELGPFAPQGVVENADVENEEAFFIRLDPLTVNVFSGNKIIATLRVNLILRAMGDDNAGFVRANRPKIFDALFRDMHAFLPRIISSEDKSMDVFLLKKRLKLATDKLYPEGQINDILIQTIEFL